MKLEQFIKENIDSFNAGELPEGSKERLMRRLEQPVSKRRRLGWVYASVVGIAASLLLIFFISKGGFQTSQTCDVNEYTSLLNSLNEEIIVMSRDFNEGMKQEVIGASADVISETIPLAEQLPEELSDEDRDAILREYYKIKADRLRMIKKSLAMQE